MSEATARRFGAEMSEERAVGIVRLRAYAKVNLDLQVGAKRPDGFHDLRTIIQTIRLYDTLTLRAISGPCQVRCSSAGVPQDRDNLVWGAMHKLWTASGRHGDPTGVKVTITKRIPVQAGLGGGTSDAVAVLRGVCRFWGLTFGHHELDGIASELGADGPFFLVGGTALGIGRGDEIYPLAELPRYWVVVAVPPRGVSTVEAYGWLEQDRDSTGGRGGFPGRQVWRSPQVIGSSIALDGVDNELEKPVAGRRPEIRRAVRKLANSGAEIAAMTGSGSAVFGLFAQRAMAVEAARGVSWDGWTVKISETMNRDRLAQESGFRS
ncbi:MAG: 4-(cytidine 5'-diphospho)-2-C-methyl-D-erythritol kinase [Acidobacteria bacterium]|nr:4-(cytidine 5'-diphospho)-2-C-methyl-D-erythritol kinase [Acidobacteriota bacterium]